MKQLTIYMILFSCVFFWASNFIIGSILIDHWDPLTVAIFRLIVIVLFLGGLVGKQFAEQHLQERIYCY